jgi:hypothetical protein
MMVPDRPGVESLGCIDIYGWAATGAIFFQIKKRGVTHTGCLLATSDDEMGKNGPVPCMLPFMNVRIRSRFGGKAVRP